MGEGVDLEVGGGGADQGRQLEGVIRDGDAPESLECCGKPRKPFIMTSEEFDR